MAQESTSFDTEHDLKKLKEFTCLSGLDDGQIMRLVGLAARRRYRKAMVLCLEGEPVDAVHFVLSGRVKLSITSDDGREQILAMPGPGDFFPFASLVMGARCTITAQAVDETTTLAVRPEELEQLVCTDPAFAVALLAGMAERVHVLEETVRDLSLRTVSQRIARVLLDEARRYGEPVETGFDFPFRFTQQDLAHLVGSSRETVSRTLSTLRRSGAIKPGRRGRVYAEPSHLEKML